MANEAYTNLTFDEIKVALRAYLKSKSEYSDHNFDGSTWGLVLDVLSWTTHYMGVHASLALNEAFLDSAQIRRNVISRAKELGYFPKQNTCSTASVHLSINGKTTNQEFYVNPGIKFSAELDGDSYTFQTTGITRLYELNGFGEIPVDVDGVPTGVATGTGNYKSFTPILIKQGYDNNVTWSSIEENDRFIISDKLIDTDTLTIIVSGTEWTYGGDQLIIADDDEVYFLQELDDGAVEVYFGDNIIGKKPGIGSDISAEWLSTKGADANSIRQFTLAEAIELAAGYTYPANDFILALNTQSSGGAGAESLDKIKKIAPKVYQTQNRLVTADDYEALVLANFSYIDAISVWGGEQSIPPQFGKVLLSISKSGIGASQLSTVEKKELLDFIDKYKIITQNVEIIDPDYLTIDMEIDVSYNQYKTTKSEDALKLIVSSATETYFSNNLKSFNSVLRLSRFLNQIDSADPAFVNSNSVFGMTRIYQQPLNFFQLPHTVSLNYSNNAIVPGSWESSIYDSNKKLVDNGSGIIQLYSGNDIINTNIGYIDYDDGLVTLNNITFPDSNAQGQLADPNAPTEQERLDYFEQIRFTCTAVSSNLQANQNSIFAIGNKTINMHTLTKDE